jgi:AcrR family transcriptional regulator
MSDDVKVRRTYRSSVREEQARRTRRSVVDAAHRLFLIEGFAATTVPAVAAQAGVSTQTVYKAFGNKARLAKAVFDVAIAGDAEEGPVLGRPALARVRAETDPRRMLQRYGEFLAEVAPRHVPVQLVIRAAVGSHPDAATVWEQLQSERLAGMARFAAELQKGGHLRPGTTRATARDMLWTYNSAEIYELLVIERGWSPRRYGRWVADALVAALL